METAPFESWADVLAYAQTGEPLYYKAPMDRSPARLTPSDPNARSPFTYQAQTRTIKIWPAGSVGRGRNRTADPFTADSGHLKRFSRPVEGGAREMQAHRAPADEHAATELVLYIENTSDLSPDGPSGQGRSVLLNALRKWKKGTYDPKLAVRLFEYLAEAGAKKYAKEFGSEKEWSTMFTPATRHEAAKQLEASFRSSAEHGEYDHIDTRPGVREERHTEEHVDARGKTRIDTLRGDLPPGYTIWTYSPGDGVTRYRFFKNAPPDQSYFGPDNGIYTALGYKEAEAFASGLMSEPRGRSVGEARRQDDRPISMTYGVLPPFEKFEEDIRRPDPDHDGHPYWPEYTRFPMELVGAREIELAERYGLPEFRTERHRTGRNTRARGFNADEKEMYGFLEYLVEQFNDGDDEAGDLASSIMSTLGYEWI